MSSAQADEVYDWRPPGDDRELVALALGGRQINDRSP